MMKNYRFIAVCILVLGWVLAACTPTGGDGVIPVTGETPPVTLPEGSENLDAVIQAVQSRLATDLGVNITEVTILTSEQVDWSDSCLGLGGPAESCLQAVTPGWRVSAEVGGQQYEVRTTENGAEVRVAP